MVGQNDGKHNLRRELVSDGFEDGNGKFACELILILIVLGKISEFFDVDVRDFLAEQLRTYVVGILCCVVVSLRFRHRPNSKTL